jgi:hypothetical protein
VDLEQFQSRLDRRVHQGLPAARVVADQLGSVMNISMIITLRPII